VESVDRTRIFNGVAVPGTEFAPEQDHYPDEGAVVTALRSGIVDRGYTIAEREPIREDSDIVHSVAVQESS